MAQQQVQAKTAEREIEEFLHRYRSLLHSSVPYDPLLEIRFHRDLARIMGKYTPDFQFKMIVSRMEMNLEQAKIRYYRERLGMAGRESRGLWPW